MEELVRCLNSLVVEETMYVQMEIRRQEGKLALRAIAGRGSDLWRLMHRVFVSSPRCASSIGAFDVAISREFPGALVVSSDLISVYLELLRQACEEPNTVKLRVVDIYVDPNVR